MVWVLLGCLVWLGDVGLLLYIWVVSLWLCFVICDDLSWLVLGFANFGDSWVVILVACVLILIGDCGWRGGFFD